MYGLAAKGNRQSLFVGGNCMKKAAKNLENKSNVIQLQGNLSIYEAGAIRENLLAGMDAGKSVSIDLQQVEEWDVVGLQLLVAALKTAGNAGVSLQFDNASEQLRADLSLLGLDLSRRT